MIIAGLSMTLYVAIRSHPQWLLWVGIVLGVVSLGILATSLYIYFSYERVPDICVNLSSGSSGVMGGIVPVTVPIKTHV